MTYAIHDKMKNRRGQRPLRLTGQIKVKAGIDPTDPFVKRVCAGKRGKYSTFKRASHAAGYATRAHGVRFYPYRCPLCSYFHVSKSKRRDDRPVSLPIPANTWDHGGRLGRSLQPPPVVPDLEVEHFTDRALHLIGLSTSDLPIICECAKGEALGLAEAAAEKGLTAQAV